MARRVKALKLYLDYEPLSAPEMRPVYELAVQALLGRRATEIRHR